MNNDKPLIGVVTVLYNSSEVLESFFYSLNEQSYSNVVLYVVDNNSPDNSLSLTRELINKVKFKTVVIAEKENWGVAKGNNIGIKAALEDNCDYVLLSNNDIEIDSFAIERLLVGLQRNQATMAVPKILNFYTGKIWAAGGYFMKYRASTRQIGCGKPDTGEYEVDKQVEYSPTCFMLIDKNVFSRVGFMDEIYFVYYDDTDFMWRAIKRGKEKLFYIHDSLIKHKESVSTGGNISDFTLRYQSRNGIIFMQKHYSLTERLLTIPYFISKYLFKYIPRLNKRQRQIVLDGYKEGMSISKIIV